MQLGTQFVFYVLKLIAMKKIGLILAILVIVFAGCEPINEPRANFDVSQTTVETYQNVNFTNLSRNAYDYEWDFGDGYFANDYDATHQYTEPGIYTVRLAAYNHDFVDYSYVTIKVIDPPTVLNIQVLEYYQRYPVEGASIIVYPTYNDWLNERNKLLEVYTDKDGIAEIEGLEPGYYYLDVWEKDHNNYALADEDVNYIKTPYLLNGKTTYFTAWVDYVSSLKSKSLTRRGNILKTNAKRNFADTPKAR
jgi:hypothetical protein